MEREGIEKAGGCGLDGRSLKNGDAGAKAENLEKRGWIKTKDGGKVESASRQTRGWDPTGNSGPAISLN